MFTVLPADVKRLRSPGGDRFAHFVNDIIRAHAKACGISSAAVHLNLQTNVGDGGVDAEVTEAATSDPMGWLTEPTAWQFKASEATHAGPAALKADIEKKFAKRRIREGYVYYACICDQLTQEVRSTREDVLLKAARNIHPLARVPHVLDANDLAEIASQYPGVVLRHFRPEVEGFCLSLEAWRPNAVGSTTHYVPTPELEDARTRIEEHLSFETEPRDAVLVVRGEAGVGKTRLAFEAVRHAPDAEVLAVFAVDEDAARRLATLFANSSIAAILVADEITARGIAQLRTILDGHRGHVRVVAIESTEEEYRRDDDEAIWFEEVPNTALDEILGANFPEVPEERRRAYVYLAEGSIRFAVELCRRHLEIALEPGIPHASFVAEYIKRLLADDQEDAVAAVALVYGVGWRDEVSDELSRLCELLRLDTNRVRKCAAQIHDAPGFIATAGRYWYVKPPIVARVAFEEAWRRWASHDEHGFLTGIAAIGLLKPFLRQVGRIAPHAVRHRIGKFWWDWADGLQPESLENPDETDQLLALVEVDPHTYLPMLRRLVEQVADDTLVGRSSGDPDRREARHELVRIARRVANLPEYFHDAEAIMLRLALAESDSRIANSATRTYRQLFKVFLSGTVLPFGDRLQVLSQRARAGPTKTVLLAVDTLCDIFEAHHSRGVDEPVIAGRIASEDWQPQTHMEWHGCLAAAVAELQALVAGGSDVLRQRVWAGLLPRLARLADSGFASALNELLPADVMPTVTRAGAVVKLESYLRSLDDAEDEAGRRRRISAEDEEELRNLTQYLRPTGLQGRLAVVLASDHWSVSWFDPASPWRREVRILARALVQSPEDFAIVMDRLFSPTLATAYEFGAELGGQDPDGLLLDAVLGAALERPLPNFPRGYVKGLTDVSSAQDDRISDFLDAAEARVPLMAFYLAASAGDHILAVERMLRLVDDGRVPAAHLSALASGLKGRPLADAEFEQVVKRLTAAAERDEPEAGAWGIRFVQLGLKDQAVAASHEQLPKRGQLASFGWRLVEATVFQTHGESSSWSDLFKALAPGDQAHAARVAADALGSGNMEVAPAASEVLIELADVEPALVMAELGRVMLDPGLDFQFSMHSHTAVFEALPPEVVAAWLELNGSKGAVELAWHLPLPRIAPDGRQEVPTLTEIVLTRFGHHREVFDRFCQATVSGTRILIEDLHEGVARRRTLAGVAREFETHPESWIRDWAREVQERTEKHEHWVDGLDEEDAERRLKY